MNRRPRIYERGIVSQIVKPLADDLVASGDYDEISVEGLNQLCGAITAAGPEFDGYDIAKILDSDGWSPTAQMVEILDGVAELLRPFHEEAVREWVRLNDIKLEFAVGDTVTYRGWTGTITSLRPKMAQYFVTRPPATSTIYCCNAEDVTKETHAEA